MRLRYYWQFRCLDFFIGIFLGRGFIFQWKGDWFFSVGSFIIFRWAEIHRVREVGAPSPHDPFPLGEHCLSCWVFKKPNWFRDKPCWQPVITCMFMFIQQLMLFQYFMKHWLYLESICNSQTDCNVIRLELLHFCNNRIFRILIKLMTYFKSMVQHEEGVCLFVLTSESCLYVFVLVKYHCLFFLWWNRLRDVGSKIFRS